SKKNPRGMATPIADKFVQLLVELAFRHGIILPIFLSYRTDEPFNCEEICTIHIFIFSQWLARIIKAIRYSLGAGKLMYRTSVERTLKRSISIFALFLLAGSLACTKRAGTPLGNGEGIIGIKTLATFENARLRCDFSREGNLEYNVNCQT